MPSPDENPAVKPRGECTCLWIDDESEAGSTVRNHKCTWHGAAAQEWQRRATPSNTEEKED